MLCCGREREKGEKEEEKKEEEERKERTKKERRRRNGGCSRPVGNTISKSGEPHAPMQRWRTSRKSVDWSAKLCEKARKKKGRGKPQWPFLTASTQHARAKSHEPRAMSHKQTHVGREWQEP